MTTSQESRSQAFAQNLAIVIKESLGNSIDEQPVVVFELHTRTIRLVANRHPSPLVVRYAVSELPSGPAAAFTVAYDMYRPVGTAAMWAQNIADVLAAGDVPEEDAKVASADCEGIFKVLMACDGIPLPWRLAARDLTDMLAA